MSVPAPVETQIPLDGLAHGASLGLTPEAHGLVLFSHGSGSGRFSPRNNFVADVLRRSGFATLLFDLLSEREDRDYRQRFNIELLSRRLVDAIDWAVERAETRGLPIGLFGASTGAAAALNAAVARSAVVRAVVSRGGRPDLARARLPDVKAATLLIVGGFDEVVVELNRDAYGQLRTTKALEIVPGATHLFEEPGTMEAVARLAAQWFDRHLNPPAFPEGTAR